MQTMKNKTEKKDFLQLRIDRAEKRGADLAMKLQKIADANGLSLNDVANLAVSAGLPMVELKLREIHSLQEQAA